MQVKIIGVGIDSQRNAWGASPPDPRNRMDTPYIAMLQDRVSGSMGQIMVGRLTGRRK